eukprot:TRINITY_DN12358_c0_g2_i1.p1 TRINITY_DN12358_c0_g2~~TRINITY_DN12358_c0_g2_i1.p1  ORF type:complete len:198 (-),score=52.86 TRINITY_DN12358_c0_g2_i1:320-913(-)
MYVSYAITLVFFFFFQAEDGIRDAQESRGLGDVYKRQVVSTQSTGIFGGAKMAMNWKSSKLDEIGKNQVWKEHLAKESSSTVLNEQFRLNPRTMIAITEKPTSVNPNLPPPKKKKGSDIDETQRALNDALADAHRPPRGKYSEPQTSSHNYGWISTPLMPKSSQFHYGQKSCEITSYTANYVAATGVSPFSNKGGKV